MPLRSKKPDKPAALVVALTTGLLAVKGEKYRFTEGERIAADAPVVRAHPSLFVSADLPDRAIAEARHAYRIRAAASPHEQRAIPEALPGRRGSPASIRVASKPATARLLSYGKLTQNGAIGSRLPDPSKTWKWSATEASTVPSQARGRG